MYAKKISNLLVCEQYAISGVPDFSAIASARVFVRRIEKLPARWTGSLALASPKKVQVSVKNEILVMGAFLSPTEQDHAFKSVKTYYFGDYLKQPTVAEKKVAQTPKIRPGAVAMGGILLLMPHFGI